MLGACPVRQDRFGACRVYAIVRFVWILDMLLGATLTQCPWSPGGTLEIVRCRGSGSRIAP